MATHESTLSVPPPTTYDEKALLFLPDWQAKEQLEPVDSTRVIYYDCVCANDRNSTKQDNSKTEPGSLQRSGTTLSLAEGYSSRHRQSSPTPSSRSHVPEPPGDKRSSGTFEVGGNGIMTLFSLPDDPFKLWNSVRIMQFPACRHVQSFLNLLKTRLNTTENLSNSLLNSENIRLLNSRPPIPGEFKFRTGLSIRATAASKPHFTLFLAVPYISGLSPQASVSSTESESLPLPEFVTGSQALPVESDNISGRSSNATKETDPILGGNEKAEKRASDNMESTDITEIVSQAYFVVTSEAFYSAASKRDEVAGADTATAKKTDIRIRTIATFKSADDENANKRSPVFPSQSRLGPLGTLVEMLETSLPGSEKQLLIITRAELLKQENEFHEVISQERKVRQTMRKDKSLPDDSNHGVKRLAEMIFALKRHSCHAENINFLLERQSGILRQLRQIFENACLFEHNDPAGPIIPDLIGRNAWNVPVLSKAHSEELVVAIARLDRVIRGRVELCDAWKVLLKDIKDSQKFLFRSLSLFSEERDFIFSRDLIYSSELPGDQGEAQSWNVFKDVRKRRALKKQKREEYKITHPLQATLEAAEYTGQVLSMFTVITNVFLPLGFFTAYYSMDVVKASLTSVGQFWQVAGPLTGLFMFFSILIALHKKGIAGELEFWVLEVKDFFKPQKGRQNKKPQPDSPA